MAAKPSKHSRLQDAGFELSTMGFSTLETALKCVEPQADPMDLSFRADQLPEQLLADPRQAARIAAAVPIADEAFESILQAMRREYLELILVHAAQILKRSVPTGVN